MYISIYKYILYTYIKDIRAIIDSTKKKKDKKNQITVLDRRIHPPRGRSRSFTPSHATHTFTTHFLHFGTGINKSQTADMYAPSTVNGDTMTGELSSMSDEKSDVNFDANDYVVSAISQYVLSNK